MSFILSYVDDLLIATKDMAEMEMIKKAINEQVETRDLGEIGFFLGIKFTRSEDRKYLEMSLEHKIDKLVDQFDIERERPVKTLPALHKIDLTIKDPSEINKSLPFRKLIGKLLFIANYTRPDIASAVSLLSRYADKPTLTAYRYAKQVLKYLHHTKEKTLILGDLDGSNFVAYADANFGPLPDRKSQSGGVFKLAGSTVGYFSRKQRNVSTCTAESESTALSTALKQVKWMQQLLGELGYQVQYPTVIFEDNQPAIHVATNNKNTDVAKNIDIKYHDVQDCILKYLIDIKYIPTVDQLADAMTKVPSSSQVIDALFGIEPRHSDRNRGVCCVDKIPATVPKPNDGQAMFNSEVRRYSTRTFCARTSNT